MRVGKMGCKRKGSSHCTRMVCELLRGTMHSQAFKEENMFMKVMFSDYQFSFYIVSKQEFSCGLQCTSVLSLKEYIAKDKLKSFLIDA